MVRRADSQPAAAPAAHAAPVASAPVGSDSAILAQMQAEIAAQKKAAEEQAAQLKKEIAALKKDAARKAAPPPLKPAEPNPVPVNSNAVKIAAAPEFEFVRVEGGYFFMGSSNYEEDRGPMHTVTITSFFMGKYPVTQKQWIAVMGNNPSKKKGDKLPVENVTWFEAVDYCNRLSQKEGLTPAYQISEKSVSCDWEANGYRLPTEAEWEYAADKGGLNGHKNTYETYEVGTTTPDSLGLYDMMGNVEQWCWDRYGAYKRGAQTDPTGPSMLRNILKVEIFGLARVARGHDTRDQPETDRCFHLPSHRHEYLGFRLAHR
jgi:formylglycine-generating enzyme required for sulfatase activity